MAKFTPLSQRKFSSPALKGFVTFLGFFLLITGIIALILSFVFFWEASCDSCSGVYCTSSGLKGHQEMDWSFLWFDVYFVIAVIVGPILIATGSSMTTKRSYLKAYPYAIFCPNCGTLSDKRNGTCPNCGTNVDPEGMFKNVQPPPYYGYSPNPYSGYKPTTKTISPKVEPQDKGSKNENENGEDN